MLQAPTTESKERSQASRTAKAPEPQREFHPVSLIGGHGGETGSGPARLRQHLAALQQTIGNQAVLRMLSHPGLTIQTKLTVNQPGDQYEQEADRVADAVMRMPGPVRAGAPVDQIGSGPSIQRKCACGGSGGECAACKEKREEGLLKRKDTGALTEREAPPIVHEILRSPGQPLDAATRAFFEPRFGEDFSGVRLYSGAQAAKSAEAVSALAYTVGKKVVLGNGRNLQTSEGRRLLAHELTHVLQQSQGAPVPLQRWTYEDSCGSFLTDLGTADDTAKDTVQAAIDSLSISPLDRRTKTQLLDSFRIRESSPNFQDLIAAVLGVYKLISSHFSAGDYTYDCSCHGCPHPATDLGCTSIGEGDVQVCIANQDSRHPQIWANTIVHELSHRFGRTEDFSYCEPSCADLTPDKAIGNAKSYELFAADAYNHKMYKMLSGPSPAP